MIMETYNLIIEAPETPADFKTIIEDLLDTVDWKIKSIAVGA